MPGECRGIAKHCLFFPVIDKKMEFIQLVIDFILHIDQHMVQLVQDYHQWTYAILFVIIFCETGLVVTPFLPGDSLLFMLSSIS